MKTLLLKELVSLLNAQLVNLSQKNESLISSFKNFFPLALYKRLRPDLVTAYKDEDISYIKHYLDIGFQETNLQKLLADHQHYFSLMTTRQYFSDVAPLLKYNISSLESKQLSTNQNTFSKTRNNPSPLPENEAHSFAQKHSLLHLKSNSCCTWIPKNSCSNLRYSIALSNGYLSGPQDIDWIHHNNETTIPTNHELLQADYSFVILRNPFKRLLSYFLDKLCSIPNNIFDGSYIYAHQLFPPASVTSFRDFVEFIWHNPDVLALEQHIRPQADFLVFKRYSDYYALENYEWLVQCLFKKIGFELIDVRDFNSISTSKGLEKTLDLNSDSSVDQIIYYRKRGLYPDSLCMYTPDLIFKVYSIYKCDVMIYDAVIDDAGLELDIWLDQL